jgi:repressor LexA
MIPDPSAFWLARILPLLARSGKLPFRTRTWRGSLDDLTERQLAILEFIAAHIAKKRFPPTIREIGEGMGIRSTNGVNDHLKALERKGFLTRGEMKSRALVPTELAWRVLGAEPPSAQGGAANEDLVEVPLVGRVAAGAPILAEENLEATLRVDASLLGPAGARGGVFALRVKGDSMIGDGILDGDVLFVRPKATASPGQIVVVMIEGEATVKRYYPEGDRIRLQPSNPRLEPIYLRAEDHRSTSIVGVAVGVFRQIPG